MGGELHKQYLEINGSSILDITLNRLLAFTIEKVIVAVSPTDRYWQASALSRDPRVQFIPGGDNRSQSVLNGLEYICSDYSADEFVMVHDAVRPCISRTELEDLMNQVDGHPIGGLLALPVTDTLKVAQGVSTPVVQKTIDRCLIWRALTPQVFRLGLLVKALQETSGRTGMTDEASAIESIGLSPLLIRGRHTNIKITYPDDLEMARLILNRESATSLKAEAPGSAGAIVDV